MTAPLATDGTGVPPSTDDLHVRRATPADAAVVHALVLEIGAHDGDPEHVRVTPARWRELLERDDVVVLLAERAGQALGYTSAVRRPHLRTGGDVLAVDDVYVRPGARRAGVGRRLLTAMAAVAEPGSLTVTWGVGPENLRAQWLSVRLGATLRDTVVAGWAPEAYRQVVAAQAGEGR